MNQDRLHDLLVRGLAGDQNAYHFFLKELSGNLRAFFRKRLARLPDDVEDLVQETLLAVHNQRHTYEVDQPLAAWIYAIARYKMIDMLRRRTGREWLNDPLEEELEVLSYSEAEALDARRDIERLLEQLPDGQRMAIRYVRLEGLSVKEAAQASGMSESAIKVSVHRGLKALAEKLRRAS